MKKIFSALISLLLCAAASVAQSAQPVEPEKPVKPDFLTAADLSYRPTGEQYAMERCRLDVYYPENATGLPVVVWFHGGGLTGGGKFIPEQLKNSGLVVVAVNYRLLPRAAISDCIDDAAAAVAWTFREAEKFGGDRRKIFVSGHSAGGYLANMIGLDKKWLAGYGVDADSIAALVPFSGQVISHYAYRESKGMEPTQPGIDEFAPLFHVRADAPPVIIVSGDREMELYGRYEETAYFWRMLKVVGHKEAYLYELDGYDHGAMADPAFHILKAHIKTISKDR
jgi:acetyl esterase/lipase